jgi:hypothetical protein
MAESAQAMGYYDWQVQTLMLAHDLNKPIRTGDAAAAEKRRNEVELELRELVLEILPPQYKDNPGMDFTPAVLMLITRATLKRATEVAGMQVGPLP